jgi:hypothetical protein
MGVAHSQNDQFSGLFKYVESGSTSNLFGFGFYNNDFLLNVRADGFVGIGTQSPSYKLHVNNGDIYTNRDMRARRLYLTDSNAYVYFTSGTDVGILQDYNGALHWYYGEGNTNKGININSSNNIGLGTSSPSAKLHVNGGVVVSNNTIWVQSSNTYGGTTNRLSLSTGSPADLPYTGSNTGKVGLMLYSNGIAIRDPYWTSGTYPNDSCWIRHVEETNNTGYMELGVGDDGTNENIYFRGYNTSSVIKWEAYFRSPDGHLFVPGYHHTGHDNNDSVLLAGGGYKAISDFAVS